MRSNQNVTAIVSAFAGAMAGRILTLPSRTEHIHYHNYKVDKGNPSTEDRGSPTPPEIQGLEQLKILFDYTKFHIGLYTTLAAAYIALMTSDYGKKFLTPNKLWVILAVVALLIAGFAGGIIASSCSHYTSFKTLMSDRLVPFRKKPPTTKLIPTGRAWTGIEHTAFWLGIFFAILSFFNIFPISFSVFGSSERSASVEITPGGNSIVLEWTVPEGSRAGNYYKLIDFGVNRTMLICVDSIGKVLLQVSRTGTTPIPKTVGDTASFLCESIDGNGISASSPDGKARKGKIILFAESAKQKE